MKRVVLDLASEDASPTGPYYLISMMIDEGRKNVNIVDLSKDGYFLSKKVPVSWNSPKRCYRILLLSGTTSQLTWEGQNETLRGKRHFLESMKGVKSASTVK